MTMLHALAALMPKAAIPLGLTQKGYGRTSVPTTANLALDYGTVVGGSAPDAGDFVVWVVIAYNSGDPRNDLTGSGWTQSNHAVQSSTYWSSVLAKIVSAGDISSPPTIVTAPDLGAVGFWVAYTKTGSHSSISIPFNTYKQASAAAPTNTRVPASGIDGPLVVVGLGSGDDGTPTLTLSSGEDGSQSATNLMLSGTMDFLHKWKLYSTTGADVTVSKSDDGNANSSVGAYVRLVP